MVLGHKRIQPGQGHDAGLQLLEELYGTQVGGTMPPIARTNRGKPYFTEGSWHFSISHTKYHVFCALSQRPVGVDAEEQDRRINLALAEKILSPGERERFIAAGETRQALLRLWILKEAAAKCSGEGIRPWPNHTDFSPEDPRIQQIDGCFVAVIEA